MNIIYIIIGILLLWFAGSFLRQQKRRNKTVCVVESNCTGCGCCVKRCPRHVLEISTNETEKHALVKYPDKCTACGDCLKKCKFNALKVIEKLKYE